MEAIFNRYAAAIQDNTEMTPADFGAVKLALRLALADAQATSEARIAELTANAIRAIAERDAVIIDAANLNARLLPLETLADRLTAWLAQHAPETLATHPDDLGAAVIALLERKAQQPPIAYKLPTRPVENMELRPKVVANGNGNHRSNNGGGETVSPPPANGESKQRNRGDRWTDTNEALEAKTVATISTLGAELGRAPSIAEFEARVPDMPTASGITHRLNKRWNDLVVQAGLEPYKRVPPQMRKEDPSNGSASFRRE